MRRDMFKVIVERPRANPARDRVKDVPPRSKDPEKLDLLPRHAPMRPARHRSKYLNENLAPLYRFIKSKVGKPWDKVYSEICENLNVGNTVQKHVRDHVPDFVSTNVIMDDKGVPHDTHQSHYPSSLNPIRTDFYVHPRTGLLRFFQRKSYDRYKRDWREKEALEEAQVHRVLGPELEFHKYEGIWYQIVFKDQPGDQVWVGYDLDGYEIEKRLARPVIDFIIKKVVPKDQLRYRAGRRQISSTELKRHGLVND